MNILLTAANGEVAIRGDTIAEPDGDYDIVIDVPDGQVLPGLINAHDHLHRNHYGRLGNPPYADSYEWGKDIHDKFADTIANGRAVPRREALLKGAWKNLFAGVTTVVHHDRWEADFDDDFPLRVLPAGEPGDNPYFVHLSEGTTKAAADEVRTLAGAGLVNESLCAVHCVAVDDEGIALMRAANAAVVWCPSSNIFLFGRTAPADLLQSGLDIMLASDSLLTGAGTLLDELRIASELGILSEAELLDAVTTVPARHLRLPEPSLVPGSRADVIVLRKPPTHASAEDVAVVIANGVLRVLDPAIARHAGHKSGLAV